MDRDSGRSTGTTLVPPRYPNRNERTRQATDEDPSGGDGPADTQVGGYRPTGSQRPTTELEAALPPPSHPASGHPTALPAPLNEQLDDIVIDDEDGPSAAAGSAPGLKSDETAAPAGHAYSVYNHGTWTAADDKVLMEARSRGQNWGELQRQHFPNKTANACRKRHERLVERRGIHDYSAERLELVAHEYMSMRQEMWSRLADRVGMKWEIVEALCMSAGLRAIQSNARSYTNRARRDNWMLQRTRDARVEAVTAPPVGFPAFLPPLAVPSPAGTDFGNGTSAIRGPGQPQNRRPEVLMPPPPLIPTSGVSLNGPLPPPLSQASFGPVCFDGRPGHGHGSSHSADPPPDRSPSWHGPDLGGPV